MPQPVAAKPTQAELLARLTKLRSRFFTISAANVNSGSADVGSFTGLPAKYRVMRLMAYNGSISLTTATVSLRTAAAGAGTALVNAQALSPITGATKFADLALAVTADTQTAATLTLRCNTAQGAAATCDFVLEVMEVP